MKEEIIDVIIIGAGIAGLTAAIYARRAGRSVLILEGKTEGGQIITSYNVGNWPGEEEISGVDLMKKISHHANNLGAKIEYERALGVSREDLDSFGEIFKVQTEEGEYMARTVIIATGTVEKEMGLAREAEFMGRGISSCATCDGAFYEGRPVVVVGGGNSALYNALYLAGICVKVYIVHRRAELRADAILVEKARAKENVEFVLESVPEEILGSEKVEGLKVVGLDGVSREILAEGIFVAVGKKPATEVFSGLVEMDKDGYIVAGEDCLTSVPGVYVAGDCRTKCMRQLITAAADGAIAGNAASNFS